MVADIPWSTSDNAREWNRFAACDFRHISVRSFFSQVQSPPRGRGGHMSRPKVASVIVLCLLVAALVGAAPNSTVVTNPAPVVTATMELLGFSDGSFHWLVRGKV